MALADQEKSSVMTPQGRPPHLTVREMEASRSPSSPDEDPLKTSSSEKVADPNYKVKFRLSSEAQIGMFLVNEFPFSYSRLAGGLIL